MIPYLFNFSPRIRFEVKIIKIGVKAKNGRVKDKGEALMAFMYSMSAVISKGSETNIARKKYPSNLGISIKGKIKSTKGVANATRTHATRYSLLSVRDFLQNASVVAVKKAQRRDRRNQFKVDHRKK